MRSKLSQQFYARKRVSRGKPTERNLEVQRYLIREIGLLRSFSHRHLVKILGSYTDKDCIAFLMQPIADYDLFSFLTSSNPSQGQRMSMRNYFGCLAGAIDYLHARNVRHRDLKSTNILVKGDRVYVTDFGTAFDWSKTNATTQHRNIPYSVEYTSPEVMKGKPRNTASDMWSLGVVFLEMVTVLLGSTISEFKAHMVHRSSRNRGGRTSSFEPYPHANLAAVNDWMEILRQRVHIQHYDKEPLQWIKELLQRDPERRRHSRGLMQDMQESASSDLFCCPECLPDFRTHSFEPVTPVLAHDNDSEPLDSAAVQSAVEALFEGGTDPVNMSISRSNNIENWIDITIGDLLDMPNSSYPGQIDPSIDFNRNICESTFLSDVHEEPQEQGGRLPRIRDTGLGFYEEDDDSSAASDNVLPERNVFYREEEDSSGSEDTMISPAEFRERGNELSRAVDLEGEQGFLPVVTTAHQSLYLLSSISDVEDDCEEGVVNTGAASAPPPIYSLHDYSMKTQQTRDLLGSRQNANPNVAAELCPRPRALHGAPSEARSTASHVSFTEVNRNTRALSGHPVMSKDVKLGSGQKLTAANLSNVEKWIIDQKTSRANQSQNCSRGRVRNNNSDPSKSSKAAVASSAKTIPSRKAQESKSIQSEQRRVEADPPRSHPVKSVQFASENLTISSAGATQTDASPKNDTKAKRKALIKPGISSSTFMSTAWDEPTTEATSVMTANTRRILKSVSFTKSMDRQYKYLEYLCQQGKARAVRTLLDKGCNPGTSVNPRPGPLMYAVKGATPRHYKCFRALLDKGADITITDNRGLSLLHLATENPSFKSYHSLVRDLVAAGFDPNTTDSNGDYPITKIFSGNETTPLEESRLAALACLLQSDAIGGTDVNIRVRGSLQTPLHLAVRRRDAYAVGMLLHKGADVNARNASEVTPLLLAANQWRGPLNQEQRTVLELLLASKKVEVDAIAGLSERTALLIAVVAGSSDAVKMLLDRGADPQYKDKSGKDAVEIAMEHGENITAGAHKAIIDHLNNHRTRNDTSQPKEPQADSV